MIFNLNYQFTIKLLIKEILFLLKRIFFDLLKKKNKTKERILTISVYRWLQLRT